MYLKSHQFDANEHLWL